MPSNPLANDQRLNWLNSDSVRPYVFARKGNRVGQPGRAPLDWFPAVPLIKDAQAMNESKFTDQILRLENHVFGSRLAMPRWVFYDCAIMPGITAGFAIKRTHAPKSVLEIAKPTDSDEWVPLSLFIVIPTMRAGEWVAHNLSSVNSALPEKERFYGLGFLSKAFGLWFANVETCCGMTQWRGPALRLHSHYGDFEVITAFTPSHTVAETLTYRVKVNPGGWLRFFTEETSPHFQDRYRPLNWRVNRKLDSSFIEMQKRLEAGEGPFFLSASEIATQPLDSELGVYQPIG